MRVNFLQTCEALRLFIQAASLWRRSYIMVILDQAIPAGRCMMEVWLNTGCLDLIQDAQDVLWGHSQYCPVPPSLENFFIAVNAPCLHPVWTSSCSSFVSFQWFPKEEEETNSQTPYLFSKASTHHLMLPFLLLPFFSEMEAPGTNRVRMAWAVLSWWFARSINKILS